MLYTLLCGVIIMACEICGKSSCCRPFHSLEEQEEFDNIADEVKERCRRIIWNEINSLEDENCNEDKYLIDLDKALKAVDNADL